MQPFEFQQEARDKVVSKLQTNNKALLQSATASGKTFIAAMIVEAMQPKQVLFLVNRQNLVSQTHATMGVLGIKCSVLHNDIRKDINGDAFDTSLKNQVIITMPETVKNATANKGALIDPDLVIVDEAHKSTSATFQQVRDQFPDAKLLGMTATPGRIKNKEGESLTEWYGEENLINTVSIQELIRIGRLVEPRYKSLDEDAHVVKNWQQITDYYENKRTILFGESTKHCLRLQQAFLDEGINAEVITTSDEDESVSLTPGQRNDIYRRFREGEIKVLISINALCEGYDEPLTQFCFLCRRIGNGNIAFFHQIVGRVLRAAEGKDHGVVVDFRDNLERFGPIEDFEWEQIEENQYVTKHLTEGEITHAQYERYQKLHVTCGNCNHVFDIKKHDNCNQCNTPHGIQKRVYVSKVRDDLYDMILSNDKGFRYLDGLVNNKSAAGKSTRNSQKRVDNIKSNRRAFVGFLDKIAQAKKSQKGAMFNNMLGVELFEDGTKLREDLAHVEKLLGEDYKKLTLEDRISI